MFGISVIMPILGVLFTLLIIVVIIIMVGKTKIAKIQSENIRTFENLANELRQTNTEIKTELTQINEKVDSMDKMMKDI